MHENCKRAYKNTKKTCKSFKLDKNNAVSIGTTAIKPHLSMWPVGLVWFPLGIVVKHTATIIFLTVDCSYLWKGSIYLERQLKIHLDFFTQHCTLDLRLVYHDYATTSQSMCHMSPCAIHYCFVSFRPPNPIEYLATYLLKNKEQYEES